MKRQSLLSIACNLLLFAISLSAFSGETQTSTPANQNPEKCDRYYRGYLWKVFSSDYYHGAPCIGFDDNARTFRIDDSQDNSDEMVQTAIKSAANGVEVYVTFDACKDAIVALSNTPDPVNKYIYK